MSLQYERNSFMTQELLDRLREDVFALDLRECEHQWLEPESDLYCFACHSLELDHLFICNHDEHGAAQVAFHDRCLDAGLGHTIPSRDNTRSWVCPLHDNMLKRRGDYDFDFDRPLKRRRLDIADASWLALPEEREHIFPRHGECANCAAEKALCDGERPCAQCCKFAQAELVDTTQPRFIEMSEAELQREVEAAARQCCKDVAAQFADFERDEVLQSWLAHHDAERHGRLMELLCVGCQQG